MREANVSAIRFSRRWNMKKPVWQGWANVFVCLPGLALPSDPHFEKLVGEFLRDVDVHFHAPGILRNTDAVIGGQELRPIRGRAKPPQPDQRLERALYVLGPLLARTYPGCDSIESCPQVEVNRAALNRAEQLIDVRQVAVLGKGQLDGTAGVRRPELNFGGNLLHLRRQQRRRSVRLLAMIDQRLKRRRLSHCRCARIDEHHRGTIVSDQVVALVDEALRSLFLQFRLHLVRELAAAEQNSLMAVRDEQQFRQVFAQIEAGLLRELLHLGETALREILLIYDGLEQRLDSRTCQEHGIRRDQRPERRIDLHSYGRFLPTGGEQKERPNQKSSHESSGYDAERLTRVSSPENCGNVIDSPYDSRTSHISPNRDLSPSNAERT